MSVRAHLNHEMNKEEPKGLTELDHPPLIAIGITTYRRLSQLTDCLKSLALIEIPRDTECCLIVVDNDDEATSYTLVKELALTYPLEIYFIHEPRSGVATARNAVLSEALRQDARYLAFVDDDETVTPKWLMTLFRALTAFKVDIVHGPVIPLKTNDMIAQKTVQVLSEKKPTGTPMKHVSTGNVLFDLRKIVGSSNLHFDEFYNSIGGEDHDFFDRAKEAGYRSVWVKEAIVYETVTDERSNLSYLAKRHFKGGIGNVLKYAHTHKFFQTYPYFILKILGKTLGLFWCMLRLNVTKLVKDSATLAGYAVALVQIAIKTP